MADTVISIGGDTRELSNAYKKAERETVSFGGKVSGTIRDQFSGIGASIAGAFAAQALVGKLKSTLDYFGDIQDLASRLNTTAENVQQLDLIGAPSGASAESLVNALSRVNRALGDADNAAGRNAFKALGIDMEKLAAASPVDQLMMLSRGFQEAQAKGQGFNEIYDLLGKSAGELIPVLRMSRGELEKLASTPVLSDDQVSRLDDLGDRLTTLSQKITIEVGGALAGFLEGIEDIGAEVGIAAVEFQQLFSNLAAGDDFDEAQKKAYAFAKELRKVNDEADEARKPIAPIVSPQLAGAQSAKETSQQNDRIGAARTLQEELALLTAKATGNQKIIDNVSREIALNRRVAEIMKEQGVNKSQALAVAKQMQALEDQAERRSNRAKGIPNKIKGGVSSSERGGSLDDFYDRQGKPMSGPATPGLDRLKELQRRPKGLDFNRRIPIGKGFEGQTGNDPLAAQAAKAAEEARREGNGNTSLEALLKTIADNTRSLADLE